MGVCAPPALAGAGEPDGHYALSEMTGTVERINCPPWTWAFWISFSCSVWGHNSVAAAGSFSPMPGVRALEGHSLCCAGHLFVVPGVRVTGPKCNIIKSGRNWNPDILT